MAKPTPSFRGLDLGRVFVLPNGTRQIELLFATATGEPARVAVDLGDVADARALQRLLRNSGFGGATLTRADAAVLDEQIVAYTKSKAGRAALTPVRMGGGWSIGFTAFALDDTELPSGRAVARPPAACAMINAQRGTLAGWKASVGKAALFSSRTILMISAALAAPTLALSGVEAGGFGFNLWGPSSTGKSTALRAAASVLAGEFAGTWNGTANGLQELAQQYCDLPLAVDSMESVSGEPQRELTEAVAYALGSGKPRVRAKAWSAANGTSDASWRTVLLSTAEAKHQRAQKTGAAVRLVDVPVARDPNDPMGIIDSCPKGTPENKRREFTKVAVQKMATGTAAHHGHVLPEFVKRLAADPKFARAQLAAERGLFLNKFDTAERTNPELRVLDHFAVVFAAGRLAITFGLLPWSEARLLEAVSRCATDALENSNDRAKRNAQNAARVLAWLGDPTRVFLQYRSEWTRAEIEGVDGLKAQYNGDGVPRGELWRVKLVLRPVLQQALGIRGRDLSGAMAHLRATGRLVCEDRDDAMTVQHKFCEDFSARFYVVRTNLRDGIAAGNDD
ncbi:MAG: hypothetical protein DI629_17805 [Mesorhizobium amorphae]|nr:MAG: hypothetical protein DI629_17805 [Mesorhizobium amorphae]